MPNTDKVADRLLDNWREEVRAAAIYRRLAAREGDPNRKRILEELSATEDRHAEKWAGRLSELGVAVPNRDTVRLPRATDLSLRFAPVDAIIANQEAEERKLSAEHADLTGDAGTDVLLRQISEEDAEHASTLRALMRGGGRGGQGQRRLQTALDRILSQETWHNRGGSWIGGAIYGVNDGLAAVFGIVSFAAAASNAGKGNVVLLAGLGGAIASAVSMGVGAYLATKSEGELYQAQIAGEEREIKEDPDEERRELELIYQLKGLSEAEAKLLADRMAQDPKMMLDVMATEELELSPSQRGKPVQSAVAAMISTGIGAIIPVVPFVFMRGTAAVIVAAAVSLVAHFVVGAAKSLVTLRSWWSSGLEMTIAGIIVGVVLYGVGLLFHVS